MIDFPPPLPEKPPIVARAFPAPLFPTVPKQQVTERLHYPVRGNWWTGCSSWHHLATGPHTGKFNIRWLSQLSWSELQSLHSDDHEGKVQWQFVPKP